MAFQPFGYRFEIRSPAPSSKVKATIRSRKKNWFDPKNGPRGWIVGPFICLWMSAFDRYGPMLVGRISSRELVGTRIAGRAGADLNGTALFLLLTPLMAWITWEMYRHGQGTTQAYVVIGLIFGLGLPLTLWIGSKDRKDAEPLVRFLRQTLTSQGEALRNRSAAVSMSGSFRMTVSGEERPGSIKAECIYDALIHAGVGDSVVLATSDEFYLQTLLKTDGFVLEKREGDRFHHYKAARRAEPSDKQAYFEFEDVLAALLAYGSGSQMPENITWEPMELST